MLKNALLIFIGIFGFKQLGIAQTPYSKWSITPEISLGVLLPNKQEVLSGNQWMTYLWKFYSVGSKIDATGNAAQSYNTTNRIGFNLNYSLNKNISITGGASRTNLVRAYLPSLSYQFFGNVIGGFYENIAYFDFNLGFKYQAYNLYYVAQARYLPDVEAQLRKRTEEQNGVSELGDYTNASGTGLVFSRTSLSHLPLNFYFGVGQEIYLADSPIDFEVGINISPQAFAHENISFYSNGALIGNNRLNFNTNAIYFGLHKTLNFKKKIKKPKATKPPKAIEVNKDTPSKVTIGDKEILAGEDLVLEHINFEQTKYVLNAEAMIELDKVYSMMKQYESIRIALSGHTSAEGNRADNLELSKKRAEACKTYLVEKGIKPNRIVAYGVGPDRPISQETPELNRRVELKILNN